MNLNNVKAISLMHGQEVLVDFNDYDWLMKYTWYAVKRNDGKYVAARSEYIGNHKTKPIKMHRMIVHAIRGQQINHIDGNPLNNQRSNLRLCSHAENMWNSKKKKNGETSQYKGVSYRKDTKKWTAEIRIHPKRIRLGCFCSEKDAALAYNNAASKYHGKFARLNDIR